MTRITTCLITAWFVLGLSPGSDASTRPPQDVEITEEASGYTLTIPPSNLLMTIPMESLEPLPSTPGGTGDGPGYFFLEDPSNGLVVSGWFVPADAFPGVEVFWQAETESRAERNLSAPQDVSILKVGDWDAIFYDLPVPDRTSSHIRAHLVQSDTWIDVHLSRSAAESSAEIRSLLESVLNSITIAEKQ